MPKVMPLLALGRAYFLANVGLLGGCVVCFGVLFYHASNWNVWFYLAAAGLVTCAAGCFVLDRLMIRQIRCPTCNRTLPRVKAPYGKLISVQYECPDCDTLWDTQAPPAASYSDPL